MGATGAGERRSPRVAEEQVPEQTDNSVRPEDGEQDVDQEPRIGEPPVDAFAGTPWRFGGGGPV